MSWDPASTPPAEPTGWTAALDQVEARLVAAESFTGEEAPSGPPDLPAFSPPPVDGDPTPEEAARALDLWRRGELVVAKLADASATIAEELATPAKPKAATPQPSMIDTRV